jgi:hypothetical protein
MDRTPAYLGRSSGRRGPLNRQFGSRTGMSPNLNLNPAFSSVGSVVRAVREPNLGKSTNLRSLGRFNKALGILQVTKVELFFVRCHVVGTRVGGRYKKILVTKTLSQDTDTRHLTTEQDNCLVRCLVSLLVVSLLSHWGCSCSGA